MFTDWFFLFLFSFSLFYFIIFEADHWSTSPIFESSLWLCIIGTFHSRWLRSSDAGTDWPFHFSHPITALIVYSYIYFLRVRFGSIQLLYFNPTVFLKKKMILFCISLFFSFFIARFHCFDIYGLLWPLWRFYLFYLFLLNLFSLIFIFSETFFSYFYNYSKQRFYSKFAYKKW